MNCKRYLINIRDLDDELLKDYGHDVLRLYNKAIEEENLKLQLNYFVTEN